MNIRFSVLMPAYNRENYVRQAIDSVLSQAFKDFELLVIDDGSTDKTLRCPNPMAPASRCFDKAIKARRSPATKRPRWPRENTWCCWTATTFFCPRHSRPTI